MATRKSEDHERAAAGLDFDFPIREKAANLGQALAEGGPQALFEEIENLVPEGVREQVQNFPILAVLAGVGVGVFLGMRKGDEVLAAGASLVSAAASASLAGALDPSEKQD
jgi:hypothetical protein